MRKKIINGLAIRIVCDYCGGLVYGKPRILKYANIERFFCCTSCRSECGKKLPRKNRINKKKI